jgi:hypothetical protein
MANNGAEENLIIHKFQNKIYDNLDELYKQLSAKKIFTVSKSTDVLKKVNFRGLKKYVDGVNLESDTSERFKKKLVQMQNIMESCLQDSSVGEIKHFSAKYKCENMRNEVEVMMIAAVKRPDSTFDAAICYFHHKRKINILNTTIGTTIFLAGAALAYGGIVLSGPIGWGIGSIGAISITGGTTMIHSGVQVAIDEEDTDKLKDHALYLLIKDGHLNYDRETGFVNFI